MCGPVLPILSAVLGGVQAAQGLFGGDSAAKSAHSDAQASLDLQKKQQADQQRESNRQNAQRADSSNIGVAAGIAGQQGNSGTMLTGPGGVDPNSLTLGRSTALGN